VPTGRIDAELRTYLVSSLRRKDYAFRMTAPSLFMYHNEQDCIRSAQAVVDARVLS